MRFTRFITQLSLAAAFSFSIAAQQTNPVERQVSNPITDTPNINPISSEQRIAAPKPVKKPTFEPEGGGYSAKSQLESHRCHAILREVELEA